MRGPYLVQNEFAGRLEPAASAQESDEILVKEKTFVTNTLVSALSLMAVCNCVYGVGRFV